VRLKDMHPTELAERTRLIPLLHSVLAALAASTPKGRGETGTGSMRSTAERPRRGNALCGIRI
ncbi:hypothetical protein NZA98_01690, partial [Escherichia coli]|nr:hypothetical protein [Escherichia coli]